MFYSDSIDSMSKSFFLGIKDGRGANLFFHTILGYYSALTAVTKPIKVLLKVFSDSNFKQNATKLSKTID